MIISALLFAAAIACTAAIAAEDTDAGDDTTFIENGINYKIISDTTVEVISNSYTGEIEIPSSATNSATTKTYNVTSIGDGAFQECTSLESVTIPDSVTSIGDSAFYGCTHLTSVTIGDNVTSIGTYAFFNCEKLTSVTIPNSVTKINTGAFYFCKSLGSVEIGKSVESIDTYAFFGCTSLIDITVSEENTNYCSDDGVLFNNDKTELIQCPAGKSTYAIPDSVKSIGNYAFEGCTSLTSVIIPDSVESIGGFAFYDCISLIGIIVSEGNTVYCSDDGVLFNKDKTELIQYPAGKTASAYEIPNSVTSIGEEAFNGCTSLTSVTIGYIV